MPKLRESHAVLAGQSVAALLQRALSQYRPRRLGERTFSHRQPCRSRWWHSTGSSRPRPSGGRGL